MNKDAIKKTAVCYWSEEDECFVVESPLFSALVGAGDTETEALKAFDDLLFDAYEAYLEGRMPQERPGRPSKNGLVLNTSVIPETKNYIQHIAKEIGCSQGEAVDFVAFYHLKKSTEIKSPSIEAMPIASKEIETAIKRLLELYTSLKPASEKPKAKAKTSAYTGSFKRVGSKQTQKRKARA